MKISTCFVGKGVGMQPFVSSVFKAIIRCLQVFILVSWSHIELKMRACIFNLRALS